VISRAFGLAIEPAAWLVRQALPESAIKATVDACELRGRDVDRYERRLP